jgi:ketosteroid isomerase-like protein
LHRWASGCSPRKDKEDKVYQILIKRHLRNQFDRLNVGDYEAVLRGVDDHVRHRFAGQHPLGGDRHSKEALRLWFQRLFRLYRNLDFEVHRSDGTAHRKLTPSGSIVNSIIRVVRRAELPALVFADDRGREGA